MKFSANKFSLDELYDFYIAIMKISTAALLSKSRKTLLGPVRFGGFKSVRILCFHS